jgi:glutamyl-tRNA reductase
MEFFVAGLRYTNASLHVREQVVLSETELQHALQWFNGQPDIQECLILTTCNRTEVFLTCTSRSKGERLVWTYFKEFKQFDATQYPGAVFSLQGRDMVEHALKVAAGLDSLILGESQILGQVKDALKLAQSLNTSGFYLDRLFKTAIHRGKQVRTETGITQRDDSVSKAAFELATQWVPDWMNHPVAIVGGGKMAEILLQLCRQCTTASGSPLQVTLVNRSEARLQQLCHTYGFSGVTWESIEPVLQRARVVFVATGAPHLLIFPEMMATQAAQPRLVLDISVPRNVDEAVGNLPAVDLKNTDDLVGYHGYSRDTEAAICRKANALIHLAVIEFSQWVDTLPAQRTMAKLRAQLESLRQEELAHLGPAYQEALPLLDELSRHLLNKWLHEPSVRLRQEDSQLAAQHSAMLMQLFGLPEETTQPGPYGLTADAIDTGSVASGPSTPPLFTKPLTLQVPYRDAISKGADSSSVGNHRTKTLDSLEDTLRQSPVVPTWLPLSSANPETTSDFATSASVVSPDTGCPFHGVS